eukprot:m.453742 g.453742  ORF g.453742 m.453742 type:complete len:269 (+) comp20541_c0_seq1:100-906(+)
MTNFHRTVALLLCLGPCHSVLALPRPMRDLFDLPLNVTILNDLNNIRDTKINPAIASAIPASIPLDFTESGSDGSCIVPSPFHGCICHASAGYDATVTQANGLNSLHVITFSQVLLNITDPTNIQMAATAQVGLGSASTAGNAHCSEDACGIKADEHGTFSASMAAVGTLELSGYAAPNITANCTSINVTHAIIHFDSLSLSNVNVNIDLGPIKIPIGDIASLVLKLIPSIKPAIETAVSSSLDGTIPKYVTSILPCLPLPGSKKIII